MRHIKCLNIRIILLLYILFFYKKILHKNKKLNRKQWS